MKIAIDSLPLTVPKTGIGFYTHHLLFEFIQIAPENDYYLFDSLWGESLSNLIAMKEDPSKVLSLLQGVSRIAFPLRPVLRVGLWFYARITRGHAKMGEMDLFFGPNFRGLFRERPKTVITIHDMAHEYYPENVQQKGLHYLKRELPRAAKRAILIIADSQNTKRDIVKFLDVPQEKIRVIYCGVDKAFQPIKNPGVFDCVRRKYHLPKRFILYFGAIEPRKNIARLIQAYALLARNAAFEHHLVIGGGVGWKNADIYHLVEELGLKNRIVFTGYVDPSDLPTLYSLSEAFVFPSLYEGFGLPVLEAMACGVPVVTSDVSSLPEVAGDAPVYINPQSVEDLADGIHRILSDQDLRDRCISKGMDRARSFTWRKCALETLKVFEEAHRM